MLKKLFLLSFIIFWLVAIPITIYLVSQQSKRNNTNIPSSTLSVIPETQTANLNNDLSVKVNIDPGTNSVSTIKLTILYDSSKLATQGSGFIPNTTYFPSITQGPIFGDGTIMITVGIGANFPPIEKSIEIGTLTFKTLGITDNVQTKIYFGDQTQVLSYSQSNQPNENLLATTIPASINIIDINQSEISPTPEIPTPTLSLSNQSITITPTPLTIQQTNSTTLSPTTTLTPTPTTASSFSTTTISDPPKCISFKADRQTTGTAPFNVNFTLVGSASNEISKATFIFGDGQIREITAESGLITGTSINALTMYTYTTSGSFTASGTITDINDNTSTPSDTCSTTVTINTNTTTPTISYISESTSSMSAALSPKPSLAPTGPSGIIILFGIIGIILAIVGSLLIITL